VVTVPSFSAMGGRLVTDETGRVTLNAPALEWYLNGLDGPVGILMAELAVEMSRTVVSLAPVLKPWNIWNPLSSAVSPVAGTLKKSVYPKRGYSSRGRLYGGVNAPAYPTMFLEDPAEQLHEWVPFMSAALWTVPTAATIPAP
jgi:hypothetical protein